MSATARLDELYPETRARVMKQSSGTEGVTTALAVVEHKNHPSYTPAEMRARSILSRMESLSAKLKTLEDDIRLLWIDFDNLKAGETILGCATKKEFCEKKLNRTPRTIQYLLAGQSNPADRPRSELSSPQTPSPTNKPSNPENPTEKSPEVAAQAKAGLVSMAAAKVASLGETAKPHAEKRKNRNDPVDDFEEVRAVSIKMLNIGLHEMQKTELNHSLLDSAKTWALCRLADRSGSAA